MKVISKDLEKACRQAETRVRDAIDQFLDVTEEQGLYDEAVATNLLIVSMEKIYEMAESNEHYFRLIETMANGVLQNMSETSLVFKQHQSKIKH